MLSRTAEFKRKMKELLEEFNVEIEVERDHNGMPVGISFDLNGTFTGDDEYHPYETFTINKTCCITSHNF